MNKIVDNNGEEITNYSMNSGAYRILIKITKNIKLQIGALGEFKLDKGIYIYSGSAMKNLRQRIERHLRKEKKIRWHIDYLLSNNFVKIEKIIVFPSEERHECELNQELLSNTNYYIPIFGFGSSDCHVCPAHLIKFNGQWSMVNG